ncbi:solute carrier family 22 member 18 isoform X2 [Pteropus alecto]|uniref:solute carrier family 22 member 18 isoform X2 n=1 Tax=Pteropus alecto TaxID=9402 RepID=UPI000D535F97|nr:solute carrier family 22 member 18 isoform X2 [Pteropus alecto]
MRWPPWSSRASSCSSLSCRTCPGAWGWILSPLATCRRPWVCFSCWAGRCLAGSRTSAGRGPRSPSLSWRPPSSTCSWRPPAPRGCRGWLCSSPRACPARSCTRCQVGPAAQMVITDLTTPEERPTALSRLGLCVGSGTILGSLLGGTLSTACGIHCPVLVAFVANLLGAILSFTYVPANTKGAGAHGPAAPPGGPQAGVFDLKTITRLLLQPGVLPVFLIKVVCGFPFGLFLVMFAIINMEFFQLEPAQASYLQSFFGILMMVIQGLLIGRLSRRFSEGALLWASVLVFCLVGLAMVLMCNVFHFCLLMPGLVFSLCTLNVVTDSMLTKAVSASDTGTMLGLCASVQPLTRTIGPTLGGLLYRRFGVPAFGHVQFAVNFLVLLVLWRQPILLQEVNKAR